MRRARFLIEALEHRVLLAGDLCAAPNADVDHDGTVTAADAQVILRALERPSEQRLIATSETPALSVSDETRLDPVLDVNRDGRLSPVDALQVINRIDDVAATAIVASQQGQVGIPDISIGDVQVVEGHAGTTTLAFPITLSEVPGSTVTVDVSVTNGTARELLVERLANGLSRPVFATAAPGAPDLLYVVEQRGGIRIFDLTTNTIRPAPFLTVTGLSLGGERGLLGLTFHPQYETNRLLYVYLTDFNGDTQIREYQANPGGLTADPLSARDILEFDQPFGNHNGGWIDFGPRDGYLYIASGDGGSANDPNNDGQNKDSLLGAILRIDVDQDDFPADPSRNYGIPADNPFVNADGADEIWAYGLRNPWRNSFDRETGDFYIADVGQNAREEINFQPASSSGGENYGWRPREGTIASAVGEPTPAGAIDPIHEYPHVFNANGGFSVTGGYVYRGPIAELTGNYFFADYVTEQVWSLRFNGDQVGDFDGTNFSDFTNWTTLLKPSPLLNINAISSFGEDAAGNLYILDLGGELYRISDGADYRVLQTGTVTFAADQTDQTFEVEVIGDRLAEPNETLVATLSNPNGGILLADTATGTIVNDDAPRVAGIEINRGEVQRSIVDEVVIEFDAPVTFDESGGPAVTLLNLNTSESPNFSQTETIENGRTLVRLQFLSGPSVEERGLATNTLANGSYRLTLDAARIHLESIALDGDGDGDAGGSFMTEEGLVRKFGDIGGNLLVDIPDYLAFRLTFGSTPSDDRFEDGFDHNGNREIDINDYLQFRLNFGR